MNSHVTKLGSGQFFFRWFDLLAKHKFSGALLPLSGTSIGYFLTLSGHIMPHAFAWYIGFFGVITIAISISLFLIFSASYVINALRKDN